MKPANTMINDLRFLDRHLTHLEDQILLYEKKHARKLVSLDPNHATGGRNLLHYIALRKEDLKELQFRLTYLGLSSMGHSESFVLHSVREIRRRVRESLNAHKNGNTKATSLPPLGSTWLEAEKLLHEHTRDLFGPRPESRHVYIMVTAPDQFEVNDTWAKQILHAGANLIRVNCAHETKKEWKATIEVIRKAAHDLQRPVRILMDLGGPKIRIAAPKKVPVETGNVIRITAKKSKGHDWIQCTLPQALKFAEPGHRVIFDDGKCWGRVIKKSKNGLEVKIEYVTGEKVNLKLGKGMNFPDSRLEIDEITKEDFKNLRFVADHADMVGLSFVQTTGAIAKVSRELKRRSRNQLGIILKIETQLGFSNLPHLLLEAMKNYPVGIMIARGDLAVEAGFERLVELQEEILWLCEAAHIPAIWATQVLESLAKTGQPSRAEVSDAGLSVRAECVMLNKGPYIGKTVSTLDDILKRMEKHTYKKRNVHRPLNVARL
jgi:pyruvate kinase